MRFIYRMPILTQFPGARANQLRRLFGSVETRLMGLEVSGFRFKLFQMSNFLQKGQNLANNLHRLQLAQDGGLHGGAQQGGAQLDGAQQGNAHQGAPQQGAQQGAQLGAQQGAQQGVQLQQGAQQGVQQGVQQVAHQGDQLGAPQGAQGFAQGVGPHQVGPGVVVGQPQNQAGGLGQVNQQFAVNGNGMQNVLLNARYAMNSATMAQQQAGLAVLSCANLAKAQAKSDRWARNLEIGQVKSQFKSPADKKVITVHFSLFSIFKSHLFFRPWLILWKRSLTLTSCSRC